MSFRFRDCRKREAGENSGLAMYRLSHSGKHLVTKLPIFVVIIKETHLREGPAIKEESSVFVCTLLPSSSFSLAFLHSTDLSVLVKRCLRARKGPEAPFIISPLIYFTTELIKKRAPRYIHRTSGGGRAKKLNAFLPMPEHASNKGRAVCAPSSSRSALATRSLFCIMPSRADVNRTCFSFFFFSCSFSLFCLAFFFLSSLTMLITRMPRRT